MNAPPKNERPDGAGAVADHQTQLAGATLPSEQALVEAEYAIVGTLLGGASSALPGLGLDGSEFSDDGMRAAFYAVQALVANGGAVDVVSVHDELAKRGQSAVCPLKTLNTAAVDWATRPDALQHHAERIRQAATQRRIRDIGATIARSPDRLAELLPIAAQLLDSAGGTSARSLDYITGDEIDTADQVFDDELVEGVIGTNAMAVVYGDSNCGKTFLAIDVAASIEQGIAWMGRRTVPGLVVYLATEAPASVRMRVAAYKRQHGVTLRNLVVVRDPVNLFDATADLDAVVALARKVERERGQKVVLVVGDTLARIAAGANENSGEDMTVVLRNADAIRSVTGAAFMWIHHCGKDAARGMRGWSGMRAAIDTEMEVTADDATGARCVEVTKQRDLGGKGQRFGFRLDGTLLGVNRWGAARTSAVVVSTDAPAKAEKGKRPSEVAGAITELLNGRAPAGMKKADIVKHYAERYDKASVYRELKKMLESGRLHEVCGIYALKQAHTSEAAP